MYATYLGVGIDEVGVAVLYLEIYRIVLSDMRCLLGHAIGEGQEVVAASNQLHLLCVLGLALPGAFGDIERG